MPAFQLTNIIEKKRNSETLSEAEIEYFVKSVCGNIKNPDECADPCQIGAMLMAIYLNGFTADETHALTKFMKKSGRILSWPPVWRNLVVDKHSTGGVGDKVSLVLAPVLAAVGLKVPMISGRALGHTGGTLDKMESIPGFNVNLAIEDIYKQVENIGCCIVGQTEDIVPADRILYRCRDLTATVNHKSLVSSSIVSKKLAEGTNALVYDVKYGKAAFFKSDQEAEDLAKILVLASAPAKCTAFLTSMDFPLGNKIGNTLEVQEAVECLQGRGPDDLIELVAEFGAELICLTNSKIDRTKARETIFHVLNNEEALNKFYELIIAQGVSKDMAKELCYGSSADALPSSLQITNINYHGPSGYVQGIDAISIAYFCKEKLSSGRCLSTGVTIKKHVGDEISGGDVWLVVHHEIELSDQDLEDVNKALEVGKENIRNRRRILKKITLNEDGSLKISTVT